MAVTIQSGFRPTANNSVQIPYGRLANLFPLSQALPLALSIKLATKPDFGQEPTV